MLFLAFASLALTQTTQAAPTPALEEKFGDWIYFDALENGVLVGGRVSVDPTNPLHADSGVAALGVTSPVTTLYSSGPSSNRIDLVFVGDGYTAAELGTYASDVDGIWPTLLAEPPLDRYTTYFNVHRVDVTSLESGVDHDPVQGILRQTALDMGYWCNGIQRLLCVNVNKANTQARSAPAKDIVLALANSGTYGGAGYSSLSTIAGHNGSAIEIALHEFGHSFADLADEYDYGGPATYSGPEPSGANVTTHTEAELLAGNLKWHLWLDLPHVSTFEGAMYSRFDIYRPTFNSKMRSLGRPFQEVNAERIVRHIYRFVRPIDAATAPGVYPLDADFFVDPLDPLGQPLTIRWRLDGVPIPGATAVTFDAGSLGLALGTFELSVQVVDETPLVRNPTVRAENLTDTRRWTITDGRHLRPGRPNPPNVGPRLP